MNMTGQIRNAKELGYHGTDKYIYRRCIDCGKEYWVRFKVKEGKPRNLRCIKCSREFRKTVILKLRQSQCKGTPDSPAFGDIRRSDEIKKTGRGLYYIYLPCPDCGKERWVDLGHRDKIKIRRCYSCAARLVSGKFPQGKGDKSPAWRGGRAIRKDGRVYIYAPEHHKAMGNYVYEHVLVWEQSTGKELPDDWEVHHLNGITSDNRPENLFALPSRQHKLVIRELRRRIRELETQLREAKTSKQGKLEI